jgi:hypothetical protein
MTNNVINQAPEHMLLMFMDSVTKGSKPLQQFLIRVGLVIEPLQQVLPD